MPLIKKSIGKNDETISRLENEYLDKLSHQLRTPLNSIIGFSELIKSEITGTINTEQKEYLDDILLSAKHLLKIINEVLEISKMEAGIMHFYPEQANLGGLIQQVLESLKAYIEGKNINVSLDLDAKVDSAYLDPMRFKQLVYNYLSNAIKFTPEYGSITIRIRLETNKFFRFEVEDNGKGVMHKDITLLFKEFVSLADDGTIKPYGCTGLGLSLVKHLVEAQGGKVGVQTTYGKGSIFYAILPMKDLKSGSDHSLHER